MELPAYPPRVDFFCSHALVDFFFSGQKVTEESVFPRKGHQLANRCSEHQLVFEEEGSSCTSSSQMDFT